MRLLFACSERISLRFVVFLLDESDSVQLCNNINNNGVQSSACPVWISLPESRKSLRNAWTATDDPALTSRTASPSLLPGYANRQRILWSIKASYVTFGGETEYQMLR